MRQNKKQRNRLITSMLASMVALSALSQTNGERPQLVVEIIIDQLQVEESEVTMDTNLMKDLSADSLDAVEIIMAIEDEYGIEIPDEDAEKFQTVRDLVKYVEETK